MRHSRQMVALHCNIGQNVTSEHPIFKNFLNMLHMLIVSMVPGQYQLHKISDNSTNVRNFT